MPQIQKIPQQFFALLRQICALPRFMSEVRAHLPVIPVLSRQLKTAANDIEQEIGSICSSFQEMASLARESVRLADLLADGENGERHVNDIIRECRSTMAKLLDRLERSSELYSKAIGQMDMVNSSVKQIFSVLGEVEKTSFTNRLLALNAKIEAVHLGEHGAGFEVVAEQISSQAARSNELIERVSTILNHLTQTMNSATTELKELAQSDQKQAEASRQDVEGLLEGLEYASSEMQKAMATTAQTSEKLVNDISHAVVSLQFQDRVNQRIGHVVESLESMNAALAASAKGSTNERIEQRTRTVSEELLSSYTMESERVLHDGVSAPEDSESATGDVELF